MSVKVGVRVRPFNKREQQMNCRKCIEMEGNTTHLIESNGECKSFVYDYSFWSHDKFMVDPDGIYIPVDDKYADQKRLYKEIGSDILINAWEGYNCCLFAYGQTGSGKSYSMIGYGENKGIIPLVCDQIFKKISSNQDSEVQFEVKVSMVQIYNQSLRDLLISGDRKHELRICQHKKLGVYIEGLEKHPVQSYNQIALKIEQGSKNRSIAATLMNQSSSRSHTIVGIDFLQKIQVSSSQTSFKKSVIYLVDLAGSQCVAKTGVNSKDRLRETAKINQSLTTLGRVIEILADNCSKAEKQFVPYRDSKLTFILRNALGGNSRTAMICAISPADDNYEETLSTLRYASRAKNIENKAIVNESDVDKLIRMLRQENQMLKKMLKEAKFSKIVINQEIISNANEVRKSVTDLRIGEEEQDDIFNDSRDIKSDHNQSLLLDVSIIQKNDQSVDEKKPYITNISEDQLLSFRLKYSCDNLLIGTKKGSPKPKVVLAALGISPNHSKIYINQGRVYLEAQDQNSVEYTYINGHNPSIDTPNQLFNHDRIIFGTGCVFMVMIKEGKDRPDQLNPIDPNEIDYQFAINEMQAQVFGQSKISLEGSVMGTEEEEALRHKIAIEMESEFEEQRRQNENAMKQQIIQQEQLYQNRIAQLEADKKQELQRMQLQLQRKQQQAEELESERKRAGQEIQKYKIIRQELESKEVKSMQQKNGELEKLKIVIEEKMKEILNLEGRMQHISEKTIEHEENIRQVTMQQQAQMQRQMQLKTLACQNQSIINQYKLQLAKKSKSSKELRQMLIKKERIELLRKLVQLVPLVQKFNLMGREMDKKTECTLCVRYKFISDGETIEALKNSSYKAKLDIYVRVTNKRQGRSYPWPIEVFKNRYQLAEDIFNSYIKYQYSKNREFRKQFEERFTNKELDPYWDPEAYEVVGMSFVSFEFLLYMLGFQGTVQIISKGHKIGQMDVSIQPDEQHSSLGLAQQNGNSLVIANPRSQLQKNLTFKITVRNIKVDKVPNCKEFRLEYDLLLNNYQNRSFSSLVFKPQEIEKFSYEQSHTIQDISENLIQYYTDKPIVINLTGLLAEGEQQPQICEDSELNFKKESNEKLQNIKINDFLDISPITKNRKTDLNKPAQPKGTILENNQVVSRIEKQYRRKRNQSEPSNRKLYGSLLEPGEKNKAKHKNGDKDCSIF